MTSSAKKRSRRFQTFRGRILAGYGGALLVIAVVFIWSAVRLLSLGQASDSILRENYKSILAADNMILSIERQDSAILSDLLAFGQPALEEFQANENPFFQWLGRAVDNITIEGEKEILTEIETGYTVFLAKAFELFRSEASPPERISFYRKEILGLFQSVRSACLRLRELNQETMFVASKAADELAQRSVVSTVILGVIAVVLGLGVSLFLSNRLARPVERMRTAASEIAGGNYDVRVPDQGTDELGLLAGQFNRMAEKLKQYNDLNIGKILAEKTKIEAILNSVDDGLMVVDSELRVTNINPMAAQFFHVAQSAAEGLHFLEISRNEELYRLLKESLESERPPSIEEGRNILSVKKDDGEMHYQFSILPIRSKPGRFPGVVLILRDITRLRELDRLKSEFVMTASHELRTPLTSIGMSIALLKEGMAERLSDRDRELIEAADEEIGRLKALVNELLELSKIKTGRLHLEFENVPVKLICEKALSVVQAQAVHQKIETAVEVPEPLPDVRADANKVTWVLVNLFGNALRFTASGGHIRVSARKIGYQVHFSVTDDGEGIPYEYQNRIFEKFVQVKSGTNTGGSGLGLAICKEIVRAHGGTIWVDSKPGEGSTFTFTLPAVV
jgi:NtrC-family two-component system sensor histidine kinase KinB